MTEQDEATCHFYDARYDFVFKVAMRFESGTRLKPNADGLDATGGVTE